MEGQIDRSVSVYLWRRPKSPMRVVDARSRGQAKKIKTVKTHTVEIQ